MIAAAAIGTRRHSDPAPPPIRLLPPGSDPRPVGWEARRVPVSPPKALASLFDIAEGFDPGTAGHARRVAVMARSIATRLGLGGDEIAAMAIAGRVHDIGKLALDPALLGKTGPLTPEEWDEIRRHPIYGANAIARLWGDGDCAAIVRHHHERWDGRGYPDGLAGRHIPLGARIVAVADALDAMTSDRPYRAGLAQDQAEAILVSGAGSQWDPRVVEAAIATSRLARPIPWPAGTPASIATPRPAAGAGRTG